MGESNTNAIHWPMVIVLLLIAFIPAFSGGLINPNIPEIQSSYSHLANSETLAQLVSTMSAPIVVIVAPIVGILLDRYRRKPFLMAAIVVYGVGTSIAFFLDPLYLILATRVLDGIAVATVGVVVPTLISDYYSGSRRESVMGWYSAVLAGGGAIAVVIGGLIADIHWRYLFLIYAIALLFLPAVMRYLPEPEVTQDTDQDEVGRAEAVTKIVRDSPVLLLLGIYAVVVFGYLTINLIQIEVPYHLQNNLGVSGSMTGIALAAAMVAMVVAPALYGRIKSRLRYISIVTIAFGVASVGYLVIGATQHFVVIFIGIIIGSAGLGVLLPTAQDWVAATVKKQYRGRALSGVTTMMYLGYTISPFAPVPLIDQFGRSTMLFIWGIFLIGVAALASLFWWQSKDRYTIPTVEQAD